MDKAKEIPVQMQENQVDIITDSKSLLQRMKKLKLSNAPNNKAERRILTNIHENHCKNITLIWCPSHCGVEGNEEADEAANKGSITEQMLDIHLKQQKRQLEDTSPLLLNIRQLERYESKGGTCRNVVGIWPFGVVRRGDCVPFLCQWMLLKFPRING